MNFVTMALLCLVKVSVVIVLCSQHVKFLYIPPDIQLVDTVSTQMWLEIAQLSSPHLISTQRHSLWSVMMGSQERLHGPRMKTHLAQSTNYMLPEALRRGV